MVEMDQKVNSINWRYVFELTWFVGVIALVIYTYYSWPTQYNYAHPDEYYVQFLIYCIFYLGMAGARWRYYQHKTFRMFLITLGASLFVCAMTLRELRFAPPAFLSIAVGVYFVWSVVVIFTPHKHG